MRLFVVITSLMFASLQAIEQEQVVLHVGQEHVIDMMITEKENISWEVQTKEYSGKAIIDVVAEETPIPTLFYHPDIAPALSQIRFVVRALSSGTAVLSIHCGGIHQKNTDKQECDQDIFFSVVP